MRALPRTLFRLTALLLVAGALAEPAAAQYFGRNRVRYDDFRFQIVETEHFAVHYYPEEELVARDVARMAERWYARLSHILGHEFDERKTIILYADDADFRQTNITDIGEGTQGVTESRRQRQVLAVRATYGETDHVLGHEMVHQFQYDIAEEAGTSQNLFRLPLFMVEGLAEYLTVGRVDPHTSTWMRDAILRDRFPTLTQLQRDPRFNEYQFGQPFWAYVAGTYGDEAAATLFRRALETPLDSAIVSVTGLTSDSLSARWEAALRAQYMPHIAGRDFPVSTAEDVATAATTADREDRPPLLRADSLTRTTARRLLARELGSGEINLSPQVSPDGRYVAYFSERDLFGIDLYLADAESGRVLKKLAELGSDPHVDALSFIESAGTWSPDGRYFAYVVFSGGDNEIAVLDVERRDVVRRIFVRGVGAIRDPAWSPDGLQLAFSGQRGGITDLYLVDVEGGTARQLTNDRYADLQPTWHPDGRRIAFVTDRGPGTDFDRLEYGPVRLAIYDTEAREIEILDPFPGAKHINPAWSPDGADLYFVSDRDGFNDIYRLEVESGALFRVTKLVTGVSGIAELSPAFSVARQSGTVFYSVFEGQRYTVYTLNAAEARGLPVEPAEAGVQDVAVLPPADALDRSAVEEYLAAPHAGLPLPQDLASRAYRPRLALEYVSQPQIGVGYDPYYGSGFGVAGGVTFLFSDQLSDQVLGLAIAANGSIQDLGGQALYLNRRNRLNYGGLVGHVPYVQVFVDNAPECFEAGATLCYPTRYYYRTFISQAQGLAQYPLNRTQRFEADLGYRRIGYDLEYDVAEPIDIDGDGTVDGLQFVGRRDAPDDINGDGLRDLPSTIHLGEGGVAFVGDYSAFGFTSPIRGGRYRIGVDGTLGTLTLATATLDYRRYFFLRPPGFPQRMPLTLAVRALHYGRYGPDASSGRLQPLYLGYGALVRGYTAGSFPESALGDSAYAAFLPRLYGSRIGIATAELRLPLLGVARYGLVTFPYLPTELVLFADAGMAWGRIFRDQVFNPFGDEIGRRFQDQEAVFSVGASARINLLGALIIEPYYAFPLSRGDVSGVFGVNLVPGW